MHISKSEQSFVQTSKGWCPEIWNSLQKVPDGKICFFVVTFEQIKIQTCLTEQNDFATLIVLKYFNVV